MEKQGREPGMRSPLPYLRGPLLAVLLLLLLVGTTQGMQCLITVNTTETDQYNPAISGDRIVWEDTSDGSIHLYDIATGTETRVAPSPYPQSHAAIRGSLVAWEEVNDWFTLNITYLDLVAGAPATLTTNGAAPAIDGQRILWAEGSPPGALSLHDVADGSTTTPVSGDDTSIEYPAISADRIAWVNGSETTIYQRNLTTGEELLVTPGLGPVLHPVLTPDGILWQDYRSSGNWDLYLFNLTSGMESQLTAGPGDNMNPAIDGTRLVWVNGTEIWLLDLAAGDPAIAVSSGGIMNDMPRISADRVVWQKFEDNGYYNIYLQTLGPSLPCPGAGFTTDRTSGIAPLSVRFTDISIGSPGSWMWEFGDGSTSTDQNPVHTYAADGTFSVSLTVGNAAGRDYTSVPDAIRVGPVPVVSFSANQTYGIAPLPVQFTDTSSGGPSGWSWDFGEPGASTNQNPVHVYPSPGTYTVTLAATNTNGTGTGTLPGPIRVLNGVNLRATTDIAGLLVTTAGSRQEITLDTTAMDGNTYDPAAPASFSFTPPASSGWLNITFSSSDGTGFAMDGGGIVRGNLSSCILESRPITPTTFTTDAGNNLPLSYRLVLGAYPVLAGVNATVWEGVTPADDTAFRQTLATKSPHFVSVLDRAYTLSFVTTNLTGVQGASLNLSVSRAWVARNGDQNNITTIRLGDDGIDEVLDPSATFTDGTGSLDFYSIPSPHGLSRFALVSAAGSSNLIQMGTRVAAQLILSHGSGGGSSNNLPSVKDTTGWGQPAPPAQAPEAPEATFYGEGPLDTTAAGITRGPVVIRSEDWGASLAIGAGSEARDAAGNPLALVSARPVPAGSVPPAPGEGGTRFTGMAYDIGPDGATFDPPATVSFTVPGDLWDPDARYTLRTYSAQSGSWEEVPGSVDPGGRAVSGRVSHLCLFGLFAAPPVGAATGAAAREPAAAAPPAEMAPVARTPMGIFTGLLGWIYATAAGNLVVPATALFVVLAGLAAFARRAWLSRHRTWITLYLASLTGLLWAVFLLASGGPPWEAFFILITVAGLNLIVHLFRFDRIEVSLRAPDPLRA
jgi:beta propeller repeat protein